MYSSGSTTYDNQFYGTPANRPAQTEYPYYNALSPGSGSLGTSNQYMTSPTYSALTVGPDSSMVYASIRYEDYVPSTTNIFSQSTRGVNSDSYEATLSADPRVQSSGQTQLPSHYAEDYKTYYRDSPVSPSTASYDYMGSRAYNEETVTAARARDYYAYGQGPSVSRTGDTSVNARAGTYLDEARASGEENYADSRGAPRSPATNTSNDEKPGSDLDERGTKPTRNKAQWRYPS